jgi:hypothetical protein
MSTVGKLRSHINMMRKIGLYLRKSHSKFVIKKLTKEIHETRKLQIKMIKKSILCSYNDEHPVFQV